MAIRWDALLVHHLARELDAELAGARLRALRLDGATRDALLLFRERTLLWRLHPDRGYALLLDPVEPAETDLRMASTLRRVSAPADERLLVLEAVRKGRGSMELVVELMDNQWNVVAVERPEGVVRHVLRRRGGRRPLAPGARYEPPAPTRREGVDAAPDAAWFAGLGGGADRTRLLVSSVAWTSPLNARAILADPELLERLHPAARTESASRTPSPVLLETERGLQPYPHALPGVASRPVGSLMEGLASVAREDGDRAAVLLAPELLDALEAAAVNAWRRLGSLESELASAEDPTEMRRAGDLILARYREVPQGADEATLADFEGDEVRIALDPALSVHENADAYYDRAARAERARERLPGLVERAREGAVRLDALLEAARSGEVGPETIRTALPKRRRRAGGPEAAALPYRTYRSSGGLEIRVGRGARHNDDLTFRHSAPGDVWLHARHAAGAHVVLRWPGPGNPPARDLQEAAVLAALNSKASTSASVPVDWTLRKHVRKPRGSRPGSVVPDRVKTLFVRPDPAAAERLGEDDG